MRIVVRLESFETLSNHLDIPIEIVAPSHRLIAPSSLSLGLFRVFEQSDDRRAHSVGIARFHTRNLVGYQVIGETNSLRSNNWTFARPGLQRE